MVLKGLPKDHKTCAARQEKDMTFSEFKTALRNHEENEKSLKSDSGDNVMSVSKK